MSSSLNPATMSASGPSLPSTPTSSRSPLHLRLPASALDAWTCEEKFELSVLAAKSGNQNWVTVARNMSSWSKANDSDKDVVSRGFPRRPSDWYSQKNCALQYNKLLHVVEPTTPHGRRKRQSMAMTTDKDGGTPAVAGVVAGAGQAAAAVTPAEAIVNMLAEERKIEIDVKLKKIEISLLSHESEMEELDSENEDNMTDERLDEMDRLEDEDDQRRKDLVKLINIREKFEAKVAAMTASTQQSHDSPMKNEEPEAATASDSDRKNTNELSSGAEPDVANIIKQEPSSAAETAPATTASTPTKVEQPAAQQKASSSSSPLLSSLLQSSPTASVAPSITLAPSPAGPTPSSSPTKATAAPTATEVSSQASEESEAEPVKAESAETPSAAGDNDDNAAASTSKQQEESAEKKEAESASEDVKMEEEAEEVDVEEKEKDEPEAKDDDGDLEVSFAKGEESDTSETVTKRTARSAATVTPATAKSEASCSEKSLPPPLAPAKAGRMSGGNKRTSSERAEAGTGSGDGEGSDAARPTRRLTRKREVSDQSDDTPVENKRLSRLRGAAASAVVPSPSVTTPGGGDSETASTGSGSGRDRRGSGATSRSSSPPTESEERGGDVDSESENSRSRGRSGPRRRSGRVGATAAAAAQAAAAAHQNQLIEDSAPNSPASSSTAGGDAASEDVTSSAAALDTASGETDGAAASEVGDGGGSSSGTEDERALKKSMLMLWDDIDGHRFANMFHRSPAASEAVVKMREDMIAIKRRIENGTLRNIDEFTRAIFVMFLNALMLNPVGAEPHERTRVMWRDSTEKIKTFKRNLALGKSRNDPDHQLSSADPLPPRASASAAASATKAGSGGRRKAAAGSGGGSGGGTRDSSEEQQTNRRARGGDEERKKRKGK